MIASVNLTILGEEKVQHYKWTECHTLCVKLVNCLTLDSIEKCLDLNNIFCCLTGRGILLNAECCILCFLWQFSIKEEVS